MSGSSRRTHRRPRPTGLLAAAPWLFGAALLLGWALFVALAAPPPYLMPSPAAVAGRLASSLANPGFWPYVSTTFAAALGGCALGVAVALPMAIGIHRSRFLSAAITPFLGATQAIPAIAIAPLLAIWVGYGLGPIVLLCALMVFFPILVSSVVGLRHVDPDVVDAARMDGAGRLALLAFIELPLALPNVLAGLRNGFALSVTGAVVGEMVMGGAGLGQLLTVQRDAVDTAGMFATIAVLCALASGLYGLVYLVERRSPTLAALRRSDR
ncbi:MAG: ABC transporter permease [Propioniciclava sp.]|uniref:ABC transporter permease n=1 Tax=Propioniciclava sp. TaxID=2038686 RepID=UPI0039E2FFEC